MISLTDSQKIGIGLTGFGVFFIFFGMILFFDKALLAIGNILFVAGLAFVIGLERTFRFFFQRHKVKATSFFLGGVIVVLIGWPIVGVVLEVYGFFLLFRGFFPVIVGFIRRIPVLGSILNLPFLSGYVDKLGESNTMGARTVTAYALAFLLVATFISRSWSAPKVNFQRRNWTPQAMLYLKGTQGRRFVSDDRKEGDVFDTLHLETRSQNTDKLNVNQVATVLLNFLQQAKDEADGNPDQMYFQDLPAWKREYF